MPPTLLGAWLPHLAIFLRELPRSVDADITHFKWRYNIPFNGSARMYLTCCFQSVTDGAMINLCIGTNVLQDAFPRGTCWAQVWGISSFMLLNCWPNHNASSSGLEDAFPTPGLFGFNNSGLQKVTTVPYLLATSTKTAGVLSMHSL